MATDSDPLGPKNIKETFSWAETFVKRLYKHFGKRQVVAQFKRWPLWHFGTMFSGVGCAESAHYSEIESDLPEKQLVGLGHAKLGVSDPQGVAQEISKTCPASLLMWLRTFMPTCTLSFVFVLCLRKYHGLQPGEYWTMVCKTPENVQLSVASRPKQLLA